MDSGRRRLVAAKSSELPAANDRCHVKGCCGALDHSVALC